jgi:hypothetical protein
MPCEPHAATAGLGARSAPSSESRNRPSDGNSPSSPADDPNGRSDLRRFPAGNQQVPSAASSVRGHEHGRQVYSAVRLVTRAGVSGHASVEFTPTNDGAEGMARFTELVIDSRAPAKLARFSSIVIPGCAIPRAMTSASADRDRRETAATACSTPTETRPRASTSRKSTGQGRSMPVRVLSLPRRCPNPSVKPGKQRTTEITRSGPKTGRVERVVPAQQVENGP